MAKSRSSKPLSTKSTSTKAPTARSVEPEAREALNLAVVRGTVSSPPDIRVLPSDAKLAQLQVTTRLADETLSMPVACWNPAAWLETLEPGDEIVVVGRVRRRFFRAGGATASRVELEAELVARAGDRRRVGAAVRKATAALRLLEE